MFSALRLSTTIKQIFFSILRRDQSPPSQTLKSENFEIP